MNRKQLDAFVAHHGLAPDAVAAALTLTDARPTAAEVERFGVRMLELAGVLSLAAGVVFFVAANWDALAVLGRFALVELALVLAVGGALSRPPPHPVGRYALLLAFVMTGVLLALFGQTYQTGADVYELFLAWALLGGVFAVAAQWSVAWAAWLLVLNVALWLFCGGRPEAGWFWIVFSGWGLSLSELLLVPMIVNLLLWLGGLSLERTRGSTLAPRWLGRFALASAVGFGTWSGVVAIIGVDAFSPDETGGALTWLVVLGALGGIAAHTLRRRTDVFPLALIAASLIALSSWAIGVYADIAEIYLFFTLAAWLVVSSTLSGRVLMQLVRAWRKGEQP